MIVWTLINQYWNYIYIGHFSKFAENVGLKFYTPEEYFQGEETMPYFYGDFDPRDMNNGMGYVYNIVQTVLWLIKTCFNFKKKFFFYYLNIQFPFSHQAIHTLFQSHLIQN